jgi:PAS domain S-box-containing protein
MNLDALFNNLLTSGIRLSDPETIRKIRIVNVFELVFIMAAPLLGLFYFYVGAVFLFYVTTIAGLLMIAAVIVLRKTKSLVWGGNCAIFVLWAALLLIAWNTGAVSYEGVMSPSWLLNAGLILFAIFLNGYMWGAVWTTLVFIETGAVIYLFRAGYLFPNLIPTEIAAVYSLGTYMVCLLAILLLAFLFEKERTEALVREQGKAEALRESKRYIDDILERYPIPTFVLDRNHRVIQWNRACHEITGIPVGEILGKEVWEGLYVDDRGSTADIIIDDPDAIEKDYGNAIVSKTETGLLELEMSLPKFKGGRRVAITVAPILDNTGAVRGAIQTVQTINPQQDGMGGLSGEAGESFPDPVFKIDSRGEISFWNRACEETFGFKASEMIGKSPFPLVSKRYRPLFKETIIRVFKGESIRDRSWKYYSNKEKPVYVLARVFPSQSADGQGKECVIVNTDITDLRIKLKRLELYAAESKEKLKSLTEEYDLLKSNIATFIRKKDDSSEKA